MFNAILKIIILTLILFIYKTKSDGVNLTQAILADACGCNPFESTKIDLSDQAFISINPDTFNTFKLI